MTEYMDGISHEEGRQNSGWNILRNKAEYLDTISKKNDVIRGLKILGGKSECLNRTSQEGRKNTWIEQPKKKDKIPLQNILRRKAEFLDRTSQEEGRIPGQNNLR